LSTVLEVVPGRGFALRPSPICAATLGAGPLRSPAAARGGHSAGDMAGRKAAGQAWLRYACTDSYARDVGVLIQCRDGEDE
jgi:hypothetical protein